MSKHQKVLVYDLEKGKIRKYALEDLNGTNHQQQNPHLKDIANISTVSNFDKVEFPKWSRHVDIYASNELDDKDEYVVANKDKDQLGVGKSFVARLSYYRLDVKSFLLRVLLPDQRVLYIGRTEGD